MWVRFLENRKGERTCGGKTPLKKQKNEGQLWLKFFFDLGNGIILTTATNDRRPTFDIIKTAQLSVDGSFQTRFDRFDLLLSLKFVDYGHELRSGTLKHLSKENCSFTAVKLEVKTMIYENIFVYSVFYTWILFDKAIIDGFIHYNVFLQPVYGSRLGDFFEGRQKKNR